MRKPTIPEAAFPPPHRPRPYRVCPEIQLGPQLSLRRLGLSGAPSLPPLSLFTLCSVFISISEEAAQLPPDGGCVCELACELM